mgnify:CR=1 FL=1
MAVHKTGRVHLTLEKSQEHDLEIEHSSGRLSAPMPGNIIRICVKEGEEVELGQTLLVMEAMKMEHPIVAPTHGRVERLLFEQGDVVKADEKLLIFDSK